MNNVQIRFVPTDSTLYSLCSVLQRVLANVYYHLQGTLTKVKYRVFVHAHVTLLHYTELSTSVEKKMIGCRRISLL